MTEPSVTLSLMGVFAIRKDGLRQRLHVAGNTKRLLMLLASRANTGIRRERLVEEIWTGSAPDRGLSSLNTAMSRLRTELAGYPGLSVDGIDDVVRLCVAPPATCDAIALDTALADLPACVGSQPLPADTRAGLETVVARCRGEFLEGCDDHWALPLRERYGGLLVQALTVLMNDAALSGDYEAALDYGRRVLGLDPFREAVQRAVMHVYVLNGQRAEAIRHYKRLERQLAQELRIPPMEETTRLYESLRQSCTGLGPVQARFQPDAVAPPTRL